MTMLSRFIPILTSSLATVLARFSESCWLKAALTGLAVGIACNNNLGVVCLSIFNNFFYVDKVLAACDACGIDVEEHGRSGVHIRGSRLLYNGLFLVVGNDVAEAGVFILLLFEALVERVHLFLVHGHKGFYVGHLFPSVGLGDVVGDTGRYTDELVPMADIELSVVGPRVAFHDVRIAFPEACVYFSKDTESVVDAEIVDKAEVVGDVVSFAIPVTYPSQAEVWNGVVEAILVVTAEHIGEVEHHVLVKVGEAECVVVGACVDRFNPTAVNLCAEADTGCEPFADGYVEADGGAVYAEGVHIAAILLGCVGRD